MNEITLQTEYDAYHPGDEIQAHVNWDLQEPPAYVVVRLFWRTSGKGNLDQKNVKIVRIQSPLARDRRTVSIELPWGPYSFSGKLISLVWTLEATASPVGETASKDLVMGPDAMEVLIGPAKETDSGLDR